MYTDHSGCYPLQTAFEFLAVWLTGDGEEKVYTEGSRIVKQLKKSSKMQSYIDDAIDNYMEGKSTTTGSGEFTSREDGYELYLSTQHFTYSIEVEEETRTAGFLWWKHDETRYTATVTIHDNYDFDSYREWNSFGNVMNNLAYLYHSLGGGKNYEWSAIYTYSTKWATVA